MKKIVFTSVITGLLFSSLCIAESPVWKVSKDKHSLYIGGTFHLLAESDYPLPDAFDKAYQKSHSIFLETDLQALQSPENTVAMMQTMMQPAGKTLADSIRPKTYAALSQFLADKGMPIENFAPYTATGVALTIQLLEMQKLGMRPDLGVDHHFSERAASDKKPVKGLESPAEHLAYIAGLAKGKEDEFVLKTISDIKDMAEMIQKLKNAWRKGDNKTLASIATKEIKRDFPEVYASLLTERNNIWMKKIEGMLSTDPVEFVLVGTLHLAGEDGLITLLKQQGYRVENL